MPMDAREIESMIREALPDATVEIRDLAGVRRLGVIDRLILRHARGQGKRVQHAAHPALEGAVALPDATVEIRDLAGDGDHYAATVVSAAFRGKSRVFREGRPMTCDASA
jgi:stress-induced morphogen